jgi:hypothetical protein
MKVVNKWYKVIKSFIYHLIIRTFKIDTYLNKLLFIKIN